MLLHLSDETIARLVDGALPRATIGHAQRHLDQCERCAAAAAAYRALNASLHSLPQIRAPENALAAMLTARASGIRSDKAPAMTMRAPGRALRMAASIAVLIGGGMFALFWPTEVVSSSSELRFSPTRPVAGSAVAVEYRPSITLSQEGTLRMRGRLRTANQPMYNRGLPVIDVARLTRGEDGVYRGRFQLPDSVVYGVFAVEDVDADFVDSNHRRGWDLLVHGQDNKPLPVAYRQRIHDHMGRSWEEAYVTAKLMSEVYPELPESWSQRVWFETQLGISGDTAAVNRRNALASLHARYSASARVEVEHASRLMYLAEELKDTTVAKYWLDRMTHETPHADGAVHRNTDKWFFRLLRKEITREAAYAKLEELWRLSDGRNVNPIDAALAGLQAGDSANAVLRWAERARMIRPDEDAAETLLRFPETRIEGKRRLRARIARLDQADDHGRDLFRTRTEDRIKRIEPEIAAAYATLGKALQADGAPAAATDTLTRALDGNWDTWRYRTVAESFLTAKDTARAAAAFARVMVDPGAATEFADSIQRRFTTVSAERWSELLAQARGIMERSTLTESVRRTLLQDPRIEGVSGGMNPLSQLTGGKPAVVVIWAFYCGPARAALPQLAALEKQLATQGVRLITISQSAPTRQLIDYLANQKAVPAFWFDTKREARNSFNSFSTPAYFVLDAEGVVRFEYSELSSVRRQVVALLNNGSQAASR